MEAIPVSIQLSDPWDLGEHLKWRPILGDVVSLQIGNGGGWALVRIRTPFTFRDVTFEYFIASPRHHGNEISALERGEELFCSLSQIAGDLARSSNPFDLSSWRSGFGAIGTLRPAMKA